MLRKIFVVRREDGKYLWEHGLWGAFDRARIFPSRLDACAALNNAPVGEGRRCRHLSVTLKEPG